MLRFFSNFFVKSELKPGTPPRFKITLRTVNGVNLNRAIRAAHVSKRIPQANIRSLTVAARIISRLLRSYVINALKDALCNRLILQNLSLVIFTPNGGRLKLTPLPKQLRWREAKKTILQ